VILAVRRRLAAQDHPVLRGVRRLVDPQAGLLRLLEKITEDLRDVDLARAQAGQPRRRLRDAPDDELLERRRLAPVAGDGLEPLIVALLALDVTVWAGPDRMGGGLLLADALHVLLRGYVLIADVLREQRRHDPLSALEVEHQRELVRRVDVIEVRAEEVRGAAERVGLEALLDRELDVFGRHLAPALVELHAGTQLERPRAHLVGRLERSGQRGAVLPRLDVAQDERVVDRVPERLLRLHAAPGERSLRTPLPDGDGQTIGLRRRARHDQTRARHDGRGQPGPSEKRSTIDRPGHPLLRYSVAGW